MKLFQSPCRCLILSHKNEFVHLQPRLQSLPPELRISHGSPRSSWSHTSLWPTTRNMLADSWAQSVHGASNSAEVREPLHHTHLAIKPRCKHVTKDRVQRSSFSGRTRCRQSKTTYGPTLMFEKRLSRSTWKDPESARTPPPALTRPGA